MAHDLSAVASSLKGAGINFVAIDFDQTLVDEHTYGNWTKSAMELAQRVRPVFAALVPVMIAEGIAVAIVTFSSQTKLISEVLFLSLGDCSKQIVIRATDRTWGDMGNSRVHGKNKFMASAAAEFESRMVQEKWDRPFDISRSSSLLIDDDANNVAIALSNGVRAIPYDPTNRSYNLIQELMKL